MSKAKTVPDIICKEDECILKLENLSKTYSGNVQAVKRIDLEVHRGETIGLVGPNGAGKTTTIKMIAKLLRPTTGKIYIRDKDMVFQNIRNTSRNLIPVGFLIDIPNFYDVTAYQVLKYFAELHDYPKDKIDSRIDDLLEKFNLTEWKHYNINDFSKGMKQKLGIIQALIHDPEILILDEPQTGLDPNARVKVRKFIRELQDEGKTIFVASHMLYEISEVCDKIALLNKGRIVAFDTLDNLEGILKKNELQVSFLNPIPSDKKETLTKKLENLLESFLDKKAEPKIDFKDKKRDMVINYDGKEKSKVEILKILMNNIGEEYPITEFTQPKASQLERIYSQIIAEDREV